MLYRKASESFIDWKNDGATTLLVYGARQVGKTYLIREFSKVNFDNLIEINFASDSDALNLLLEVRNYDDFLEKLSLLTPMKPGQNDVLFLDEIQIYYEQRAKMIEKDPEFEKNYVDILTLAKPIAEKGPFRFVLSGSMLGVTLFNVRLNPTGYVKELTMYPLDFEEFLLASGINSNVIDSLKDSFFNDKPVTPYLNKMLLNKFKEYVVVGGMPKPVDTFVRTKDYASVALSQDEVINWYRKDILKYAPIADRLIINEIYERMPSELYSKNRKFVKSHLEVPNARNLEIEDKVLWLYHAGIAIPTYNVQNPKSPLKITENYKIVKLFANDVGLLTNMLFPYEDKSKLLLDDSDIDLGALYENACAEILLSHHITPYFISLKKEGEVDFLFEKGFHVFPIEIKSGKGGEEFVYRHKALDRLLETHQEIKKSYVFGNTNVFHESERIANYPIYMIEFLRK